MGARSLRDNEYEFIQAKKRTEEIANLLRTGRGAQAAATKRIEQLYLEKFGGVLTGETDQQYQERLSKNPKATRMHPETKEGQAQRLKMAPSRILGILKRDSENFSRRRRSQEKEETPPPKPSPPKSTSTGNAYREFQASKHPSKLKMNRDTPKSTAMRQWNHDLKAAFDALSPEELKQLQQQAEAKAVQDKSEEGMEARRAKYVETLPDVTKRATHTWQKEGGWVGMIFSGGIDQHGQVAAVHRPTGRDRSGKTFEERLAEEFRCTPRFIEVLFLKWLADIFDAPIDDLEHKDSVAVPMTAQWQVTPPSPTPIATCPATRPLVPPLPDGEAPPAIASASPPMHTAGPLTDENQVPRSRTSVGPRKREVMAPISAVRSSVHVERDTMATTAAQEERARGVERGHAAQLHDASTPKVVIDHPFMAKSAPPPAALDSVSSSDDDDDGLRNSPGISASVPPKDRVLVPKLAIPAPAPKAKKVPKKPPPTSFAGTGRRSVQAVATQSAAPSRPAPAKKENVKSKSKSKSNKSKGDAQTRDVLVSADTNLAGEQMDAPAPDAPGKAQAAPKKPAPAKQARSSRQSAKSTKDAQPVSTRSGRTVVQTARILDQSPDYSAAKHAKRSGPVPSSRGKHARDSPDVQDDEPRKKHKTKE